MLGRRVTLTRISTLPDIALQRTQGILIEASPRQSQTMNKMRPAAVRVNVGVCSSSSTVHYVEKGAHAAEWCRRSLYSSHIHMAGPPIAVPLTKIAPDESVICRGRGRHRRAHERHISGNLEDQQGGSHPHHVPAAQASVAVGLWATSAAGCCCIEYVGLTLASHMHVSSCHMTPLVRMQESDGRPASATY